jgi:hypothetical protein
MPSIALKGQQSKVEKSGFEAYDGPELTRNGLYRAVIKKFQFKQFSTGAQGFTLVVELEAEAGSSQAQYDGMPFFPRVVIGEKEGSIRAVDNLLAAVGVKVGTKDPKIVFEDGDLSGGVDIKSVGGITAAKIIGRAIKVDVGNGTDQSGNAVKEVRNVYIYDGTAKTNKAVVDEKIDEDEDDLTEDVVDEEAEDDEEFNARSEELTGLSVPALKKIAKEAGLAVGGSKDALIERILDAEFPAEEEGDGDDEEEDEDDVEVEDDEEDEDEEDEEEDEDDGRAEREAEIADFNRNQLKAAIKPLDAAFKFLKSQSDDDLRSALLDLEFGDGETPF